MNGTMTISFRILRICRASLNFSSISARSFTESDGIESAAAPAWSDEFYAVGPAQDQRRTSNAFPGLPFFCPPNDGGKTKGLAIDCRKSLSDKMPKRGLEPPLPCGNQLLKLDKAF